MTQTEALNHELTIARLAELAGLVATLPDREPECPECVTPKQHLQTLIDAINSDPAYWLAQELERIAQAEARAAEMAEIAEMETEHGGD